MATSMIYGDVCSGISAPTVAWAPLGWRPAFYAEVAKFPSSVLKHHYPVTPNRGDFTRIESGDHEPIDLLVGGTPCQDFSVAGLRAGMDGARGQLTVEFAHLAGRLRPRWLVWENVPGVLSVDGGRAFGIFLGMLGELGYGFAYRVLDAQHFGVPQRRRRVFVVGHLGDWRRAAAVLFERQSLSGDTPPRRKKGQGITHELAPSLTASGRGVERAGDTRGQDPVVAVAGTGTESIVHCVDIAPTLNAHYGDKQGLENQHINGGCGLFVAHSLRGEGFDASEDGTGRGTPLVPVAFSCKDHGADAGETSPTLRAMGHNGSHANAGGQVAVAMNPRGRDGGAMPEMDHLASLRAASGGSSRSYIAHTAVRRLTPRECERLQELPDDYTRMPGMKSWRAIDEGETPENLRALGLTVRLSKKSGLWRVNDPDGPRYKALGNSMAVPCMKWLGERIQMVENLYATHD